MLLLPRREQFQFVIGLRGARFHSGERCSFRRRENEGDTLPRYQLEMKQSGEQAILAIIEAALFFGWQEDSRGTTRGAAERTRQHFSSKTESAPLKA